MGASTDVLPIKVSSLEEFEDLTAQDKSAWWDQFFLAHPNWIHEKLAYSGSHTASGCITKEERKAAGQQVPVEDVVEEREEEEEMSPEQKKVCEEKAARVLKMTQEHPEWSQGKMAIELKTSQTEISRYQRKLRAEGKLGPVEKKFGGAQKREKKEPKVKVKKVPKETLTKVKAKVKHRTATAMVKADPVSIVRSVRPKSVGTFDDALGLLQEELTKLEGIQMTVSGEISGIRKAIGVLEGR